MDSVGVDAAFARQEYIDSCIDRYPTRFGGGVVFDHMAPDLEEQIVRSRETSLAATSWGMQQPPNFALNMGRPSSTATGNTRPSTRRSSHRAGRLAADARPAAT